MVNGAASMVNIALRQVDESIPLEPATEWTVMLLSPPGFYSDFFIKHVFPMQGGLFPSLKVIRATKCGHNAIYGAIFYCHRYLRRCEPFCINRYDL